MKDIINKITYEALDKLDNEAIETVTRLMSSRIRKQRALARIEQQQAKAEKMRMDKLNQRLCRIAASMGMESDKSEED